MANHMNKILILMRHAEAINATIEMEDFNRPLSKHGIAQATKQTRNFNMQPELVVVSTALRTMQTFEIFNQAHPTPKVQFLPNLYLCNMLELQRIIAETSNEITTLMVIAHNPSLHEFAYYLSAQPDDFIHDFPTSTIVAFNWHGNDWQNCIPYKHNIVL